MTDDGSRKGKKKMNIEDPTSNEKMKQRAED